MSRQHLFRESVFSHDYFIWLIAAFFSLSVHFILFFQRHHQFNAAPSTIIQETITHVRFSTLAPPPVIVTEPEVETPKLEPVIPPEPVPIKEPIVEKKKPEPVAKPKPKPEKKKVKKTKPAPKVKPVAQKKPDKQRKKPVQKKQPVSQNISPQRKKTVQVSPVLAKTDPRLIEQTRMSYQALLMRHIEVHKHYPRVARKRKIEGEILVSFILLENGSIKNLQVSGKKSILKKASHQAVEQALPMPQPPEELSFPLNIKFTMNYFLK